MFDLEDQSKSYYQEFLKKVVDSKMVYGLFNGRKWASVTSTDDAEHFVYPVWSSAAKAKRCAKKEWDTFVPTEFSLEHFLENWLPEAHHNYDQLGPNWDKDLIGLEVQAVQVFEELQSEIHLQQISLRFENYVDVDDVFTSVFL